MSITVTTMVNCDIDDCRSHLTGNIGRDAQPRQARSAARTMGWRHTRGWDICPQHPDITNYNLKDRKHT